MQNQFTQMMQFVNMMKNPNQAIDSLMQNNPMMKRAMEMSNGRSPEQIQQVCRNICEQRGLNYDQMLQQFQSMASQFGINPQG